MAHTVDPELAAMMLIEKPKFIIVYIFFFRQAEISEFFFVSTNLV
jgi:hypothetical protein